MDGHSSRIWLKNPLAVFTANDLDASGGVVVEGQAIVDLVGAGGEPELGRDETFDAGRHVLTPGLVNTHNDDETERRVVADQLRQIALLRLAGAVES